MTAKSRKLAWQIIELFGAYGERDIDDAITLLETGEILRAPAHLARKLSALRVGSTRSAKTKSTLRPQLSEQEPFDPEISAFTEAALRGDILPTSRHLREYFDVLGMKIPSKMPGRSNMVKRIAREIALQPPEIRRELIHRAQGLKSSESSLRAWSNLIVKS